MISIEVVRLFRLDGTGPLKAFVDIVIEGVLVIKGVKVVEGTSGLFVKMPSGDDRHGRQYDIVVPMSSAVKDEIKKVVLEAYNS